MNNVLLESLMQDVSDKGAAYAKKYNEGGGKKTEMQALKKAASNAMDKYNSALEKETYKMWADEGNAVKTAVRTRYIPGAKRIQYKTNDDNYMTIEINSNDKYEVNLPMMQATIGRDAFADPAWFSKCGKLAYLVAEYIAERLGCGCFEYSTSQAMRDFDFPDNIDPLSDDGVVMALQQVIDSILYIESPDNPGVNLIKTTLKKDKRDRWYSPEWQHIREAMTARTDIGKINIVNTGKFTGLVLDAMHLIMTNGDFSVTSEAEKFDEDKPADKQADAQQEAEKPDEGKPADEKADAPAEAEVVASAKEEKKPGRKPGRKKAEK